MTNDTDCRLPTGHRYDADGRCQWCDAERGPFAVAPDGTPVSDILAHNRELAAELARIKRVAQDIEHLCNEPHWTAERRWKVRDLAMSIRRPEAAEARRVRAEMEAANAQ